MRPAEPGTGRSPRSGDPPHTFVLLGGLIVIAAVIANVIPAGQYVRNQVDGRTMVDPTRFAFVAANPPGVEDVLLALPRGLSAASDLVFCFLIIGGALGVVTKAGLVEYAVAGIHRLSTRQPAAFIPVSMVAFAIGGGTIGIAGEILPFLPALVLVARRLGYDEITGAAIAILGAGAGVAGAVLSPFTVGLSQQLAGLPLYSGAGFRTVAWLCLTATTIAYVSSHARRHRIHPIAGAVESVTHYQAARVQAIAAVGGIVVIGVGTIKLGWGLQELAAAYIAIAVTVAAAARLSVSASCRAFADGARSMVTAALVVGLARSVPLLLEQAQVTDTILRSLATIVQEAPNSARPVGIYLLQLLISFVVPSGTGQAVLTVPILAPLGDLTGVTRQTTVLAYQFGDAFSNVLSPNVAYFVAALEVAGIPWTRWAKFVWPLFALWCVIGLVFVLAAHAIRLGPF